jgi:hypothetical protein
VQTAVSGLDQEYPGKIVCENVDATTPEAEAEVGELGFENHGLVIRSADGATLWKQPDHEVDMVAVRKAIGELAP